MPRYGRSFSRVRTTSPKVIGRDMTVSYQTIPLHGFNAVATMRLQIRGTSPAQKEPTHDPSPTPLVPRHVVPADRARRTGGREAAGHLLRQHVPPAVDEGPGLGHRLA